MKIAAQSRSQRHRRIGAITGIGIEGERHAHRACTARILLAAYGRLRAHDRNTFLLFLPDRFERNFQFFSTRQLSPAAFSLLHTLTASFFATKGPIRAR